MQLKLYTHHLKALSEQFPGTESIEKSLKFMNSGDKKEVKSGSLSLEHIEFLNRYAKDTHRKKGSNFLIQNTNFLISLRKGEQNELKLTSLKNGKDLFIAVFSGMKKPYLFKKGEDCGLEKYLVNDVKYRPASTSYGSYSPAEIEILLLISTPKNEQGYPTRRSSTVSSYTISFLRENLHGVKKTCVEHLADRGFFLYSNYDEEKFIESKRRFIELRSDENYGKQFNLVSGFSKLVSAWHSNVKMNLVDGEPDKVIMDSTYVSITSEESKVKVNPDDEDGKWEIPIKNELFTFSLRHHKMVSTHVENFTPYVYDTSLMNKLVLDKDTLDFIDIAISAKYSEVNDIISGKSKGRIFLLSGPPGVGKTLTVEVISEQYQMPVYQVQCSQLGVTHKEVSDNLDEILHRASRWGCLLYFDEADVYLMRRGNDLTQNAIVGVFLVALERYNGILFMSTNRGHDIDDAILSRAMAHIRYREPDYDSTINIFEVLCDQLGVDYNADDIVDIANFLHGKSSIEKISPEATSLSDVVTISGRDILSLIKMSKPFVESGRKLSRQLIEHLLRFKS